MEYRDRKTPSSDQDEGRVQELLELCGLTLSSPADGGQEDGGRARLGDIWAAPLSPN